MIKSIEELAYGGKYHKYFHDSTVNPKATITDGLADCDCFVLGEILSEGLPSPVSSPKNADTWHKKLTNGWYVIPFNANKVEVGDVIQWVKGCHVARVSKIKNGVIYINGSFYTGIHGRAYYNGSFDKRTGIKSMKELWEYMYSKYPSRVFHNWKLDTESSYVGSKPENIIKPPKVTPVEKNKSVDQINILTNEQNIRDKNNKIIGVSRKGYYNVLSTKKDSTYTWYEIENGKWVAGVTGRVIYYPGEKNAAEIKKLQDEIKALEKQKADIEKQINTLQLKLKAIS